MISIPYLPCQVMQEKAAQRLLAQTLHQQMLEELRNNPQLAADPEQQLQFRRLAQQQLLFQMALAAQVTSRPYLACISRISRLQLLFQMALAAQASGAEQAFFDDDGGPSLATGGDSMGGLGGGRGGRGTGGRGRGGGGGGGGGGGASNDDDGLGDLGNIITSKKPTPKPKPIPIPNPDQVTSAGPARARPSWRG